jgi:uncharacterized protein YecA (UPF0149 family)
MSYPCSIEELEQHFDNALSKLRVHELPLPLALKTSLTIFEDRHRTVTETVHDRLSAEAAMLHHKRSIEVLVPTLFMKCKTKEFPEGKITITQDMINTVTDALDFCERYYFTISAYTAYHQKQFKGSLSGRVADFRLSSDMDIGRSLLNFALHKYHEQRTVIQSELRGSLPPSIPPDKGREAMHRHIKSKDLITTLYSIPEDVYTPIREIVEATQASPTVAAEANCGKYSVAECYEFWLEFMTLMLIYTYACEEKKKVEESFNLLNHRILQLDLPQLVDLLAIRGTVKRELATSVLSDLVLDVEASRPDVLIQPLIPIPNTRTVLIAPSLIFTTNWEVCLLRNWVRLYPDIYRDVIASKKGELAKSFGITFDSERFVIAWNRKLIDGQGRTIGDVDVAVFDPADGLLALFEVKWLIEPDSPKETTRAEQRIAGGIEQVLRNRHEFERDAPNFLKKVFVNHKIEITSVTEVKCYVVGHGYVGLKDDEDSGVYILDYLLSIDIIAASKNIPLRQLLTLILAKQREISDSISNQASTLRIKLAGCLLRLPGFSPPATPYLLKSTRTQPTGRNSPCICGSGMKYKKCCLELESYADDVV